MEKEKMCPLMTIVDGVNKQAHCLKDGCAWWDGFNCSILTIATAESMLVSYFRSITRETNECLGSIRKKRT